MIGPDRPLIGARVALSPLAPRHLTPRYVGWLNDPEVNAYSRRRDMPPTDIDAARAWVGALRADEGVLAIEADGLGHVGNIKFGPIDRANARADLSILIGERAAWGRGLGAEATYLTTRWLFETMGLNRIDAGSANPAFLRMVDKLGWRVEGVLRERVRLAGRFVDWSIVALLARDRVRRPEFERSGDR